MKSYDFISTTRLLEVPYVVYTSGMYTLFLKEIVFFFITVSIDVLATYKEKWKLSKLAFSLFCFVLMPEYRVICMF